MRLGCGILRHLTSYGWVCAAIPGGVLFLGRSSGMRLPDIGFASLRGRVLIPVPLKALALPIDDPIRDAVVGKPELSLGVIEGRVDDRVVDGDGHE